MKHWDDHGTRTFFSVFSSLKRPKTDILRRADRDTDDDVIALASALLASAIAPARDDAALEARR
jgi:hypothetical protein|eukprot:COSAG01_NODE_2624_length_7358_cov_4.679019_2_plen_64_part_00